MDGDSRELPSTTLVIFGISGDLAHRYLLPALAEICQGSEFRARLRILGLSRRPISTEDVLTASTDNLKDQLQTLQIDYGKSDQYHDLKNKLDEIKSEQIIFYFAVPPKAVLPIVGSLGLAGLNGPHIKLLMEKPFGTDLSSAQGIVKEVSRYFKEEQVYRIDHYLAKEMAQNIAVFLGSNAIFRRIWNKDFIDYIEIVVAEKIGIEGRGHFYEQTGALRDIIQSHGLQLAALTLMEPCPHDFDFSDLPQRRLAALKHLNVAAGDLNKAAVRAQYSGYKEETGNMSSSVETFAALELFSDDPRWQDVPIFLATGKNLDQRLTQIRINFKKDNDSEANTLVLRVQPREGIELDLWVKQPGYERRLQKKTLSFSYEQDFEERLPNAYEQIIVDAVRGSQSLFAGSGEVLESWRIIQPVLGHWKNSNDDLRIYKPGSTVEEILDSSGR
jgi:glucose-6-phosphate 1-dehydrogenase